MFRLRTAAIMRLSVSEKCKTDNYIAVVINMFIKSMAENSSLLYVRAALCSRNMSLLWIFYN